MPTNPPMRRRDALRAAGAAAVGLVLTGCDAPGTTPISTGTAGGSSTTPGALPAASAPATPSPGLPDLPAEVVNGPRDRPRLALTFHGQGDPALATQVLTALESGGARATVMAVGSWLQNNLALGRRILAGGHELGNHTQNHLDIARLDDARALAEIQQCAQVLRTVTGSIGTWFRPSQTQHATPAIRAQATRAGYPTCLSYDVDSLDYTDPGPSAVARNTLDAAGNGSIVSLHLGHPGTLAALPRILDGLRQRGLTAVTMTELMTG